MPALMTREVQAPANVEYKHDSPGTPTATGMLHGPGGLLTYPGVDQDMFSTIVGDLPGIMGMLQTRANLYRDPTFQVLTGVHAGTGDEPAGDCDNAPVGGVMKAGIYTLTFGRIQRSTREVQMNRLGQLNDRADPVDLRLVNSPIGSQLFGPGTDSRVRGNILTNEVDAIMFERAMEFHRVLSRLVWAGNPNNTPNPDAGYVEFAGFDTLINTNWRDVQSGNALPSLYPDIKDAGYVRIDSEAGTTGVVRQLTYMMRYLRDKARRQGMSTVRFVMAMRPELFYELSSVWPCAYYTTLCSFTAGGTRTQNIDLGDQIAMRDRMRGSKVILIDGIEVEVVEDDWIPQESSADNGNLVDGCFASDIYIIPLSANGRAVTYFDYFDFTNTSLSSALQPQNMLLARVEGNGAWLEVPRQTNFCWQWQAKIEPRLMVRTPWLFGRITNVAYCPLQMTSSPDPASGYWQDGGSTTRPAPSLYKPW